MRVAGHDVGIGGMFREDAGGLVEAHLRQRPALDRLHEIVAVLQVLFAILRARREACVIVEGLMVRLEIQRAVVTRIDDRTLLGAWPHAVLQRGVPAAGIPDPAYALRR